MQTYFDRVSAFFLSVPVRVKVLGMVIFPVVLMGLALNYWVQTGLSDWLSYLLTDRRVAIALDAGSRSVFLVSILVATISILLTSFLLYILTQPLLELGKTANKVARGELNSRARIWSADEIGDLASSINQMIDKLVSNQEDLENRNRELLAINRVALAATHKGEIHDVLYRVLVGVLETLNIEMGWIYLYDSERQVFHLATWYGVPDHFKEALLDTQVLCDCQARALEPRKASATPASICKRLPQGLHHRAIPLTKNGGSPMGVLLVGCTHPRQFSSEETKLLDLMGVQITEMVSNAWLQIKLEEKERVRQNLLQALVRAQEDERARLARELHDGAGQSLTSLLLHIKSLGNQIKSKRMQPRLEELCSQASDCIEYVRQLSHQIRPAALEELGLEQAIRNMIERISAEGKMKYQAELAISGLDLPDAIEVSVYRIIQEGLTNILRHSGADWFRVALFCENESLLVEIEDNGKGFAVEKLQHQPGDKSLGILGMIERINLLAGKLHVTSRPGGGTYIRGELPLITPISVRGDL